MSSTLPARHGYRGYVSSRSFMGQRAPQHVQNIVIRDFAARRGLHYLLSVVEYTMPGCYMMLEEALRELPAIEGIVAYSLFMLPQRPERRREIYRRVLEADAKLYFAVEAIGLEREADIGRLEDIWQVAALLPDCALPPVGLAQLNGGRRFGAA